MTVSCVHTLRERVPLCSYTKAHDRNNHDPKYVVKTSRVLQCELNENGTELPRTHVSAALETLQDVLIGATFLGASGQGSCVLLSQAEVSQSSTKYCK